MKVIMLDIDGVFNHAVRSEEELKLLTYDVWAQDYTGWDANCVKLLDDICKATKAKVVISSTWRKLFPDITWWHEQFKLCNAEHVDVIGITGNSHNGFRGREVNNWLADHPEVTSYIVLDDDSDFYPDQPRIQVNPYEGALTIFDAIDAIRILRGDVQAPVLSCITERNPL